MAAVSSTPSAEFHSHYCERCKTTGRDYKSLLPSSWSMQFQDSELVASFTKSDEGKNDSKEKSSIRLPAGESYVLYCFETGSTIKVDSTKINMDKNCAYAKHGCK